MLYEHPRPLEGQATPEQKEGFEAFERWRRLITEEILEHSQWVIMLKKAATANAEAEERAAQKSALKKWELWINEGPASGLRRQHQYSRIQDGWAPTKASSGLVAGVDEKDEWEDLDGVSQQELNELRLEESIKGTPASAQQEAYDQARKWEEIWTKGAEDEELTWPEECGMEWRSCQNLKC